MVNLTIYHFLLPGARVQNALNCNVPMKTMDSDCQKKQGMLV